MFDWYKIKPIWKKAYQASRRMFIDIIEWKKNWWHFGKLTCHQYNGSSTIDLSIVSLDLYEKVQFFKVLDPAWFSDHCPVKMSLTIGHSVDETPINRNEFVELDETFQWSEEGSYKFSEMLNSERIQKRLQEEVINKCKTDANDPNIAVVNFNNIIQDISKDCLSPKSKICTIDNVKNRTKWMNMSCFKAKKEFKFSNNMGRRLIFLNAKKTYKRHYIWLKRLLKRKTWLKSQSLTKKLPNNPGLQWKAYLIIQRETDPIQYILILGNPTFKNCWISREDKIIVQMSQGD